MTPALQRSSPEWSALFMLCPNASAHRWRPLHDARIAGQRGGAAIRWSASLGFLSSEVPCHIERHRAPDQNIVTERLNIQDGAEPIPFGVGTDDEPAGSRTAHIRVDPSEWKPTSRATGAAELDCIRRSGHNNSEQKGCHKMTGHISSPNVGVQQPGRRLYELRAALDQPVAHPGVLQRPG